MKGPKLVFRGALCALLALACSTTSDAPAAPEQPAAASVTSLRKEGPGSLTTASSLRASATVEAIDHATRKATLRLADGRVVAIKAGDEVRNLAQVKVGDQVNVTYFESVAIHVRREGEATPGVSASAATVRAGLGQLPAGAEVDSVTVVATVQEIDRATQTVTLESREGTRRSVTVHNPAQLDHVAVGDLVEITFTEAFAIAVERPPAP
jgi:hypothetical protein